MFEEKCMVCNEIVDETSYKAAADGVWFHNQCFKCSQCDEHLSESNYSLSDGILYCRRHFDEKVRKHRRLPRGLSLPKPRDLQRKSSKLSSIFFKARSKPVASKLPPSEKRKLPKTISNTNVDSAYTSDHLTTINQTHLSSEARDQLDQINVMNLFMQNPTLHGLLAEISNQTDINSHDLLKNTLEQLTQNPEMMNAINQLGMQMEGDQDLGSMFASMSCSNDVGDHDMSLMFQQMMPLFSQDTSSRLLDQDQPKKHERLRRSYSDTASINALSMDYQMNIKEAARKINEEYSALDIFSSVVESAALLDDNGYDVCGLADLCSEEELAEEFMVMLKHDVCRRLGKRYDRCTSVS